MRYPPVSPCHPLTNVLPLVYFPPDVAPAPPELAATGRRGRIQQRGDKHDTTDDGRAAASGSAGGRARRGRDGGGGWGSSRPPAPRGLPCPPTGTCTTARPAPASCRTPPPRSSPTSWARRLTSTSPTRPCAPTPPTRPFSRPGSRRVSHCAPVCAGPAPRGFPCGRSPTALQPP